MRGGSPTPPPCVCGAPGNVLSCEAVLLGGQARGEPRPIRHETVFKLHLSIVLGVSAYASLYNTCWVLLLDANTPPPDVLNQAQTVFSLGLQLYYRYMAWVYSTFLLAWSYNIPSA